MAQLIRSPKLINSRRLALFLASTALVAGPAAAVVASGTTYTVSDEAGLIAAINAANANAGNDTIVLSGDIALTGALPTISDVTTLNSGTYALSIPSGSLTFSAGGSLQTANGGQITGSGSGNTIAFTGGVSSLNLASGSTVSGNVSAAGTGSINATIAGTLGGSLTGSNNVDTLAINGGTIGGASLMGGNDIVTYTGGDIAGVINAGGTAFGGDRFTATVGAGNSASIDVTNLRGFGGYALTSGTLNLSGTGQTQVDWVVTSGASVNLTGALSGYNWTLRVDGNNNGSAVNISSAGTIGGYVGVFFNGAPNNSLTNAGSISTTQVAVTTNGQTAVNNSGTIASSISDGFSSGFGVSSVTNSGTITGSTAGVAARYVGISVANQSGGFIAGTTAGFVGGSGAYGGLDTITNANGAGITGITAISTDGRSGLTLTNNGQIIGGTTAINTAGSGSVNVTNSSTGVIASGTLASAGATYVAGTGTAINVVNGGTITNAGTIAGTNAINFAGTGSITNQSGGTISGATNVSGNGTVNLTFANGSTAGDIGLTGAGVRNVSVDGTVGALDASAATGRVNVALGSTAVLGSLTLTAGNDFLSDSGAVAGAIDGGAGTDTYAYAVATGQSRSLDLGNALAGTTNFELLGKTGGGTLTLTGALAPGIQGIAAGDGGNNDGLLIFDGTSGLTAPITVNGAIIRANTAGAFGTGTITTIDPTIQYAATGTYANDIVLAVPAPASGDPTRLEALNGSVATLTGSITSDPAAGANQYVTIGGTGTIVLTNTGNSWGGVTTIDSGATLQGASGTISGGSIVDNGTLAYVQAASGTVARNISGSGVVNVSGLGSGNALTFSGTNSVAGGINVVDGSAIVLSGVNNGANSGAHNATLSGPNAALTVASTGVLSGSTANSILVSGAGNSVTNNGSISGFIGVSTNGSNLTIVNASGATLTGFSQAIQSTGSGATTVTNDGDITGGIQSIGGGNLNITNNASGNIVRTSNAAIDVVNGGALTLVNAGDVVGASNGLIGRNANDSVTNSGRIAAGTISGNTITSGGATGVVLLSGGSISNLAGGQIMGTTAVSGGVVTNVTNAGSIIARTASTNTGVAFSGTGGSTLVNQLGGTISGGRGVASNNVATITNAGTITSNCAIPSFQCAGIILFNGGTINNSATGVITSSGRGIGGQGTVAATIINDGSITSTLANDLAVILFAGGSITNNASGTIANANGYGAYVFSRTGSITNAGSITGQFAAAIDSTSGTVSNSGSIVGSDTGVAGYNATLGLTNSGQISGGTYGVFGDTGATNVTNLSGGTISSSGGAGIYTNTGPLTVNNQAGASINAYNDGIRTGGTANVTNAGMIVATNGSGINAGGALTLNNSGTINGGNSGLFLNAGGTVTNSGSIISGTAGANRDGISAFGALNLTNSGSISGSENAGVVGFDSLLTVNNQAGGTITGGTSVFGFAINAKNGLDLTNGGMLSAGSGTTTAVLVDGTANINLLAGSLTTGDIVATGGGSRTINVDGVIDGSINTTNASSSTAVTLGSAGSLGNVLFGSADDSFTTYGGTILGTLAGGDGSDRFTANVASGDSASLDLGSLTAFEAIEKLGLGSLILTGTAASPDAAIFAGNGYNDDGLVIFDGTSGLTGDIYVNGAIIRANTAGAFGTGTIHTIDPTVQYAATGTYANDILLSVPAPASADPTRLEALNSATATLTGAITSDPAADPDQYVTIGGDGTIVLTNTANAWTGTTTVENGATLQGASDTISGSNIVADGTLAYVQAYSGSVAEDISGNGRVNVSGLGAGNALSFDGTNSVTNGFHVLDGSAIVLTGSNTALRNVSLEGANASVTIASTASLVSNGDVGVIGFADGNRVDNQGSITGGTSVGVALYGGNAVLTNGSASNGAALISGGYGVSAAASSLNVDNYGVIIATDYNGIDGGVLTVTNHAGGQIVSQGNSGVAGSHGIFASGALTLDNAGQIVGRYTGVTSNNTIDLTNSGLIGSGFLSGTTFSYSDGNDGIQALNGGTINNLAGGQILGSISGIYTTGAALGVTNAGLINGANANGNGGVGIYSDGGGLTLNNLAGGTVSGAINGIADLTGNGIAITNAGTISGDTAILTQTNGATIDNLAGGQLNGVTQAIVANAAFTLTNSGSVTANNNAILTSGGGTIVNNLGGTISGGSSAFQSTTGAASTITNSGDITGGIVSTGGGNLAITNNASGNIVRVVFGSAIDLSNGGQLTLNNAGDIVGSGWGVVGRNAGDAITNSGRIASGTISGNTITVSGVNAIELQQGGAVTNLGGGQITGQGNGVTGGTIIVDNRSGALISGVANAVNIGNNSLVTNAGTITGGTANGNLGVSVGANSTVTNLAGGSISGTRATQFSGVNDVLNNSGTITSTAATASQGYAALFFNGGTVNNFTGGTLTGQYRGVSIQGGAGNVTNAGTIRSNTDVAVLLFSGGSVVNQSGGLIDGQYRGVYSAGGLGTVTNAGTIRATVDNGVSLFGGGTVNNLAGGTITALGSGGWGIYATGGAVNLTNAGLINADTGIVTNANGAIVTNSGTINGTVNGVMSYAGTSQSLTNSGTISAATGSAIAVTGASTITNSGTLTGGTNATYGYGAQFAAGSSGSLLNQAAGSIGGGAGSILVATNNAVSIDNYGALTNTLASTGASALTVNNRSGATIAALGAGANGITTASGTLDLTNAGTIRGDNVAVYLNGAATINNSGLIAGGQAPSNGDAIATTATLSLTNSGQINGGRNAGVIASNGGLTVNNLAGGTITGGNGTFGYAVNSNGTLNLTNAGTLSAGAGNSIAVYSTGDTTINLLAGSVTNGAIVRQGAGVSTVDIAGALNGVFDASTGTSADTITLASTGSIGGALLGSSNDSFTTRGGAINGAVNGGAGTDSLTFDIGGATNYNAGLFDAFESRQKIGSGTLTLTGTDVMTTDFAVNAGTLVLSGGSALNDGAALVTAAGTTTRLANANEQVRTISGAGAIDLGSYALILGGNDTSSYSGVISGSGSLAKFGTGTLTLSGANTYTGTTQISGGILRLGASNVIANASIVSVASGATFDLAGFNETIGGLTGAGTVTLGAGRLTDDQATNTVFSGAITGTGGLTKAGIGRLDLTGASTYTGATFVNGGTLAVNGSLASAVTVNSGGTLGGNGTVGSLALTSGGILNAGNGGLGHLNVAGPVNIAAGSIFQVDVTPTAADSVSATGAVTIGGGTVQVLATGTAYSPLARYTILDTTSTLTGTFANVTSNLAFLTPGLEYTARSAVLVLRRNDINFTDIAANPNQAAVAGAVQSTGSGALYDAILVQSAGGARQAYDALSGEVYASTETAILAKRDRLQDAMASNRLRSDGMGLWLDAGRGWGNTDQSASRGSAVGSTDTYDMLGGFNWARGSFGATLAGGRVIDKLDVNDRASKAKAKSWLLGGQIAYGDDLGLHAVAGGNYGWHKVATDRSIVFPGFAESASSSRKGNGYHLFGEVGYAAVASGVTVEPFAGLSHDRLKLDGTSEVGGLAALDVRSVSRSLTTTQAGVKLSASADLGWARFTPRASVAWQHVMGDRAGQMNAAFQSGGIDFGITGTALAKDSAKIGADLGLDFGRASLTAGYSGTIGGVSEDHTAKVAFQLKF